MYLLAPFTLQNFKNVPELWVCALFGPKMVHSPPCPPPPQKKFFFEKLLEAFSSTCHPLWLYKILKKYFQQIQSYENAKFLGPKWPISQNENFFRNPVNEPCFFHSCLSTCQNLKSDINLLVKYWRLLNTEISLAKSHFWL